MTDQRTEKKWLNSEWLLSPWAILISMLIGVLIGADQKNLAALLAPYGRIFLSFLQMCILPILLSAVASSLGGLMKAKKTKGSLKRMVVVFAAILVVTSLFGIAGGLIGKPGSGLNEETQAVLGDLINKSDSDLDLEMSFSEPNVGKQESPGMMDFFMRIIPKNIAQSMSGGRNLQVLFFAVILGIAVGTISKKPSDNLIIALDAIYLTFSEVIKWAMYALPFGLLCLLADQVSQIGVEILLAMTKFIAVFYITAIIFFILTLIVIWYRSDTSFLKVLSALKEPIIIVLATRSSLATIPAALSALHDKLSFDKAQTNLLVPLGVTIGRFGNVFFFALSTIFIAQLYNVSLGFQGLCIVFVGSILGGMATSGATGVLTLSLMLIVLDPLGLPFEAVLILFIAIDPIIDPMRSLLIVHTACTATAMIAKTDRIVRQERIYSDERFCFVETDEENWSVIDLSPFGMACRSEEKREPSDTLLDGSLVLHGIRISDFQFKIVRATPLKEGGYNLGFEIVDNPISMDKFETVRERFERSEKKQALQT